MSTPILGLAFFFFSEQKKKKKNHQIGQDGQTKPLFFSSPFFNQLQVTVSRCAGPLSTPPGPIQSRPHLSMYTDTSKYTMRITPASSTSHTQDIHVRRYQPCFLLSHPYPFPFIPPVFRSSSLAQALYHPVQQFKPNLLQGKKYYKKYHIRQIHLHIQDLTRIPPGAVTPLLLSPPCRTCRRGQAHIRYHASVAQCTDADSPVHPNAAFPPTASYSCAARHTSSHHPCPTWPHYPYTPAHTHHTTSIAKLSIS